jgi:hypothetical protein
MTPENTTVLEEAAHQDVFEAAQSKRLTDKQNYLLSWLTATPSQLRCGEIDAEKRFETVLAVLHKERSRNVLPFKPRTRK